MTSLRKALISALLVVATTGCIPEQAVGGAKLGESTPQHAHRSAGGARKPPTSTGWVVYAYGIDYTGGGRRYQVWCTHPGNRDPHKMRVVPVSKAAYQRVAAVRDVERVPCPG